MNPPGQPTQGLQVQLVQVRELSKFKRLLCDRTAWGRDRLVLRKAQQPSRRVDEIART